MGLNSRSTCRNRPRCECKSWAPAPLIREVSAGQARAAGVNSVYWDGRDSRGDTLGYGLFLYQVEAVAEDGRTVREMRPFVNVR